MRTSVVSFLMFVMAITAHGADVPTEPDALGRDCAVDFTNAARSPGHSSGFDDPPHLKAFAKIPPTIAFAGIVGLAGGWILLPTFIANRRRAKHRVSIRRWAIGSLLFAVTGWMLLTPIAARQQESDAWELMGRGFMGSATLGFLLWIWTLVRALRDEPETSEAA